MSSISNATHLMTIYVIVIISAIDAPAAKNNGVILIVQQSPPLIVDNQVVCDIVSHIKAACSFVNIHG